MCIRLIVTAAAMAAQLGTALAADSAFMMGPAMLEAFAGKSIRGVYADGRPFTETMWADGKDSYHDVLGPVTGQWLVAGDLICFEYFTSERMSGGCFRVQQTSSNCFDFYSAPLDGTTAKEPELETHYVARASVEGKPKTCPEQSIV